MAGNNFPVGRDGQAVLIAPDGTRIDLSLITNFQHTAQYKTVTVDPLNSPPLERNLPNGHRLRFDIDRTDAANEAVFKSIEQAWWTVGSADPGTSPSGTAYFYINETDGSQTTHQFSGLTMKLSGIGDWKTDSAVKQTIECFAQRWN